MRHWKVLAATGLLIGIAAVGWDIYARQTNATPILPAQDYADIMQLYARQTRGMDFGPADGSLWAGVFTPDGEFSSPSAKKWAAAQGLGRDVIVGRKELQAFAANNLQRSGGTGGHHWNGNVLVEPSAGGARASVYLLMVSTRDRSQAPETTVAGLYEDLLVKTADGWRIKRRVFQQAAPAPDGVQ
jgi:hypothetical protein